MLMRFRDLPVFACAINWEHPAVVHGDHREDQRRAAPALDLRGS